MPSNNKLIVTRSTPNFFEILVFVFKKIFTYIELKMKSGNLIKSSKYKYIINYIYLFNFC